MSLRAAAIALLCALAASGGFALFAASFDVREGSLSRAPLSLFGGRYRYVGITKRDAEPGDRTSRARESPGNAG